jgi:uncharacterized protein (DUF433 family)
MAAAGKGAELMEPITVGPFLVVDPRVCHGKMTLKGTRVPVETVLSFLAQGETIEQVLQSWPEVKREAVEQAILLAMAGWPELLREPIEQSLRDLAAKLKRRPNRVKGSHEPDRSGCF